MTKHSINSLSDNTGLDRRTIKRRLGAAGLLENRTEWTLPEALPVLFTEADSAEYAANRNRLVIAQTKRVELENAEREGRLVDAAEFLRIGQQTMRAMVETIQQSANLEYEDKEKLCKHLREMGERMAGQQVK